VCFSNYLELHAEKDVQNSRRVFHVVEFERDAGIVLGKIYFGKTERARIGVSRVGLGLL